MFIKETNATWARYVLAQLLPTQIYAGRVDNTGECPDALSAVNMCFMIPCFAGYTRDK